MNVTQQNESLTPPELKIQVVFSALQDRLEWRWLIAEHVSQERLVVAEFHPRRRLSLVGYLNIIYPHHFQVIGIEEMQFLNTLDDDSRHKILRKIIDYQPCAIILTRDHVVPEDLQHYAEEADVPLWVSSKTGHEVVMHLQYYLARALAKRVTLHGTLMEILSIGVLITGDSGVGKSELALELISRGHRLVADDAPELTQIAPDMLDGACPELLKDLLEVRGLGVLNIREMFGDTAIKHHKYLRLIIHLAGSDDNMIPKGLDRLHGNTSTQRILDVDIPRITIPVAPGRNLAVLVEAAVRSHALRSQGVDTAQMFIDRQAHQMRRQQPW